MPKEARRRYGANKEEPWRLVFRKHVSLEMRMLQTGKMFV